MSTSFDEQHLAEALGRRLREVRSQRGMSGSALARALGVTPSTISNWEAGYRSMTGAAIVRTAAALGVHPALLVHVPELGMTAKQGAIDLISELPDVHES